MGASALTGGDPGLRPWDRRAEALRVGWAGIYARAGKLSSRAGGTRTVSAPAGPGYVDGALEERAMDHLNGQHIVITGASRGIGAAAGRYLAAQGAKVVLAAGRWGP